MARFFKPVALRPDDILFFVHIPKTAGTSMIAILDAQYRPEEIFPHHHFVRRRDFEAFTPRQLARFRMIRAHLPAGPGSLVYEYLAQTPVCITMLRHPVARMISLYHHVRRTKHHPNHREVVEGGIDLETFVRSPEFRDRSSADNHQTLMVVGGYDDHLSINKMARDYSPAAWLEIAKQRLEQFAFFGLTERFDESMELMARTLGWPAVARAPRLNAAPRPTRSESVSDRALAAIEKSSGLDLALYRHAETLFAERLAEMRAGGTP